MRELIRISIVVAALGLCFTGYVLAQPEEDAGVPPYLRTEHRLYQDQYNREQFDLTDTNGDGYLSPEELAARPAWTGGYFFGADDERIAHADTNGDGLISLQEAKAQKMWEIEHAQELHQKYGRELKLWYKDREWLKAHPEVAKTLMSNANWLDDHPGIAKELYGNRKWLAQHPAVAKALYSNRKWLLDHPQIAKRLFEYEELIKQYPEITKEVFENREFLAKHPDIAKKLKKEHKAFLDNNPKLKNQLDEELNRGREIKQERGGKVIGEIKEEGKTEVKTPLRKKQSQSDVPKEKIKRQAPSRVRQK